MNLIIDHGNTRCKLGIFDNQNMILSKTTLSMDEQIIRELCNTYNLECVIISSVSESEHELSKIVANYIPNILIFSHTTPIPIQNNYQTPQTLGKDRLALAVACSELFPNENALAIDAGTALTFDFLLNGSIYEGGSISPGLLMRFKALHHFTKRLPDIQPNNSYQLIGYDTQSSILSGVQNGMVNEINGSIINYVSLYSPLKIIITGGDAEFFAGKLKNPIFVDLNLVLKGLNRILLYNA